MSNEFESCTNCIHADDAEPFCILRLCKHAIAETKECYMPKVQPSFPQRHENDCISRADVNRVIEDWFRTVFGVDSFRKTGLCRELRELPSAQPERTCVNCGRTVNNGGWYADGETRCPIEEHYALPKDGYCHLWEKRNVTDDDYPEGRADE